MENIVANRYLIPMTEIERNILEALTELESTVKSMPSANPKPNLLTLFERIESLADQLPRSTAPGSIFLRVSIARFALSSSSSARRDSTRLRGS